MKKLLSPVIFAASVAALVCVLALPMARGADQKSDKRKSATDADTKKYDRNGNGKLDPDEEAAMKADQAKAKAEEKKRDSNAKKGN